MSTRTHRRSVVFSGGGTGGHVFPGLAVAEELRNLGWRTAWIGRPGSFEERLVTAAGVEFRALPARAFVDRGALARMAALGLLAVSTMRAAKLLRRLDAVVVFATGGFVCAPAAFGARLNGAGLYLLEPNAQSGAANRLLSRVATEAGTAFESTAKQLACEARRLGVPVRKAFRFVDEPRLRSDLTRVLVLGGSQGSDALNRQLPGLFARVARRTAIEVTHQAGASRVAETRDRYRELGGDAVPAEARNGRREHGRLEHGRREDGAPTFRATVEGFIEDTAAAMEAHDLIVSRAGAVTVAEVAAAGRPAVYVPLPLAGGHQRGNAQAMVDAGAALLVEQDDLAGDAAAERCAGLMADRLRLASMARAARAHGRGDAARLIAERVCALADASTGGSKR